jgi:antitoxin ParD1/3/4
MNVSLTPQLERMIAKKVKGGQYQTASEVVREGLRLLRERDEELDWVRAQVQIGIDEIERGEYEEYDETTTKDLIEDIKRRGRERLAAERKAARRK